jgi:hypothetical protein
MFPSSPKIIALRPVAWWMAVPIVAVTPGHRASGTVVGQPMEGIVVDRPPGHVRALNQGRYFALRFRHTLRYRLMPSLQPSPL